MNLKKILGALTELSSRSEQERLWLSDGDNGKEVGSPTEAMCELFDDSGLSKTIEDGGLRRSYSTELNRKVAQIKLLLSNLPMDIHPREVISHPVMEKIRETACELADLFTHEGGGRSVRFDDPRIISWIFLSLDGATCSGPTNFSGISKVAETIGQAVPTEQEIRAALSWLSKGGLTKKIDGKKWSLTDSGRAMLDQVRNRVEPTTLKIWNELEKEFKTI